jgi:hypothetical protein
MKYTPKKRAAVIPLNCRVKNGGNPFDLKYNRIIQYFLRAWTQFSLSEILSSSVCQTGLFTGLSGLIPLFRRYGDIDPEWCMPPLLFVEVGITVVFSRIELNLSRCVRQEREPAPCPLVLRVRIQSSRST